MSGKTPKRISDVIPQWIDMYQSGINAPVIAHKFNVHPSVVYRHLRKNDTTIRTKSEIKLADLNPMWKGDKVGLISLHEWVSNRLPKPDLCPNCLERPALDLANVSPKYNQKTYTRDLKNWEWLCRKCHMVKDGRLDKMYHGGMPRRTLICKLCGRQHHALGYCRRHYQQWKLRGKVWL